MIDLIGRIAIEPRVGTTLIEPVRIEGKLPVEPLLKKRREDDVRASVFQA